MLFVLQAESKMVDSYNSEVLKASLHSIRFLSAFVRFFLHEKVCSFSSAFSYVHIRTNQTVTGWTKVFRKIVFVNRYSSVLKYRSRRLYTNV